MTLKQMVTKTEKCNAINHDQKSKYLLKHSQKSAVPVLCEGERKLEKKWEKEGTANGKRRATRVVTLREREHASAWEISSSCCLLLPPMHALPYSIKPTPHTRIPILQKKRPHMTCRLHPNGSGPVSLFWWPWYSLAWSASYCPCPIRAHPNGCRSAYLVPCAAVPHPAFCLLVWPSSPFCRGSSTSQAIPRTFMGWNLLAIFSNVSKTCLLQ